jgi:hypothetical protein
MAMTLEEHAPPQQRIGAKTLGEVRKNVQEVLENSHTYWAMPPDQRKAVANAMVRIGTYLVDGENGKGRERAAALASPNQPPPPDTAGSDFGRGGGAVAAEGGVGALVEEVNKVDFPKFVASLIHGTFDAIVTASIRQMDAYATLLKNVTKSLDSYMRDNVTQNNARDYLAQQYPDHLQVDASGSSPVLKPKDTDQPMPDFMKELGLPQPVQSLDDDTVEQQLVPAARERMALDRQHLLATMVLMGINRLVVTDGDIEAKVLFQLDTKDKVSKSKQETASFSDTYEYHKENSGWFSPTVTQDYTSNFSVSTTKSESSAAEVNLHTQLSGQVSVHFKSETFPLDKVADIIGVDHIQGQVVGTGRNLGAQPAGTAAPPPLPPPLTVPTPAAH